MATFTREVGIAFGAQSTEGTADNDVATTAGSMGLTDGIIRGDAASGIAKSGVTHAFTRRLRDNGEVTASFTKLSSDFLEEEIALSFAFPMAGNRATTTNPAEDADFDYDQGINDLLAACGLSGAASSSTPTVGWDYTPADVAIATARIFDSGMAWVIRDIRGDWSLSQTPGEIGIMTCTLKGIVDSFAEVTFPTFAYGVQDTVNAPSVESVGSAWSFTRGWTDLTISCVNNINSIPDSNSDVGHGFDQDGRVITVDMTIRDDSTNIDYSRERLILEAAPTDDFTYTVGTAAGNAESAVAYQIECNNLEVQSNGPDVAGRKAASKITGICTSTTDGGEFSLALL